ncbi:DUF5412 domain-containing protein [Lysinibacillus sphaericus]
MDTDTAFKREKRRVFKEVFTIFLIVGFITAGIFGYGVYWLFYDMGRLPEGEFLTEETSPDGTYTVRTYVANGGATVSYAVRGELIFNKKENKVKTIYWDYREESADITWKDDDTVVINGHMLDVPGDRFDFRHD